MDVFDAVRTLLAVRSYQDKPVPEEVIRRVLDAGRLTASGMNSQPLHFVVVQDRDTLRQLGALARTGPYVAQAPAAIVVAIDKTPLAVSDGSRAIQSLLGIPDDLDLLAILPLGYPAEAVGKGKKQRKPLGEVAYRERYGQPFE